MENFLKKTIGEMVAADYRTAQVFKNYKIDFCCKGNRSIAEASKDKNIDVNLLIAELEAATHVTQADATDYKTWSLDLLANYIEKKHHRYVEEKMPILNQYLQKLCQVHGVQHPELFEITEEFKLSSGELAVHMKKEEFILFPYIRKMAKVKTSKTKMNAPNFGTVQNPVQMMMNEHTVEGDRFAKISELSNNYTIPADGCNTYRVAFALLNEFEQDLHLHIHLENNILFPGAILLEKELTSVVL
ncbi:MAG: iron-sulfur cluster repair di-iron protein [Cyclobacteriaceae bacterium]|jgi:regulator of cell morphogenesis and NO signaling|nr:iron-sulfur cluster repair di-iron protein [Cyclobacteriaceae bacterium]